MRRILMLASGSVALAAAVACAASNDDDETLLAPENDAGQTTLPDAGSPAEVGSKEDVSVPTISYCSDAGWCATTLPDPDLDVVDIWPFEHRAFAIAESATIGTKVLEWSDESASWSFIDDNSQNTYGSGHYAGKIWAPNENEVYYAVAPSLIYHGTRATPTSPWTWVSSRLPYNGRDFGPEHDPGRPSYSDAPSHGPYPYSALGVWGTSAEDVYAWYANTIFHWKSEDGGAPGWVAEHVIDDPNNQGDAFFVFGASGSSSDDVWFGGGRGRYDATGTFACPMAVHKTPGGYRRHLDYTINPSDTYSHYNNACTPKAGVLNLIFSAHFPGFGTITAPWRNGGWLTNIASARPGAAVAIMEREWVAYVGSEGAGVAILNSVGVRGATSASSGALLNSISIHGSDAWISGWGLVLKSENKPEAWAAGKGIFTPLDMEEQQVDGGATYSISTTVLNGAPLDRPLYQVRGTSNENLWAVGLRYALHKTTP